MRMLLPVHQHQRASGRGTQEWHCYYYGIRHSLPLKSYCPWSPSSRRHVGAFLDLFASKSPHSWRDLAEKRALSALTFDLYNSRFGVWGPRRLLRGFQFHPPSRKTAAWAVAVGPFSVRSITEATAVVQQK